MSWYYGDVEDTIIRSGITATDLFKDKEVEEEEITAEEQFENYVEKLLIRAKEYIDFYTNNEFEENEEERSSLVDDIAERIASNMLNIATKDQTNQVMEVNKFNAELVQNEVMTKSIRKDLDMLPSGDKVSGRGDIAVGIVKDEGDFDFYLDLGEFEEVGD